MLQYSRPPRGAEWEWGSLFSIKSAGPTERQEGWEVEFVPTSEGDSLYSHSIVAGGLDEMSYTTRFTPRTSLMMRFDMRPSTSYGMWYQSAVM
jgi:hypothetical protein